MASRNGQKRAVGYIRVSNVGGREGDSFLSPEVQREKIEAWASYKGWRVTDWYTELDVSGTGRVRRPEFERMLADAAAGKFEAVAVYRLTRFARSVKQAAEAYAHLCEHDVALVSCTEDIDTTTASGAFMQNVMFAMAEFESQRIGEEAAAVHAARRRKGIAHVAQPVLGYDTNGARIAGVNKREAEAVRLMFELRAKGRGYGEIRNALERAGYRTKQGNERFPQTTVSRVLRNPLYAALVESDGELIEAQHPAIVSRELWEQVKRIGPFGASGVARQRAGLLSGLLVCAGCGFRMGYESSTSNGVPAYRCMSRQRSRRCERQAYIRADYADEFVDAVFFRRLSRTRMPNNGRVKVGGGREHANWTRELARRDRRMSELRGALDRLAEERYVTGTMEAAEYERQMGRFLAELAEHEQAKAELDRLVASASQPPIEAGVLDLWPQLPLKVRQDALRLAINSIAVHPSPRKGAGQRELVPERLGIHWTA